MKTMRYTNLALLLLILLLVVTSCQEKSSIGPGQNQTNNNVANISLTSAQSELWSLPNTPATTDVTATVTDSSGTAVSGVLVNFTTDKGSISVAQDTTKLDGKVTVTYNSQGQSGAAIITASVAAGGTTKSSSISIYIHQLTGLADDINLFLETDLKYLPPNTPDSIKVTITVVDSTNKGIQGSQVDVTTNMGSIAVPALTNPAGTTTTYLQTNQLFGMFIVTASVNTYLDSSTTTAFPPQGPATWPGTKTGTIRVSGLGYEVGSNTDEPRTLDDIYVISATDTVSILPVNLQISSLNVSASPSTIFAAPDTSTSTIITALVWDSTNSAIPEVPVNFATDNGYLSMSSGFTNQNGAATTVFHSLPNTYGTAKVWAVVGTNSDTCIVNINATAAFSGEITISLSPDLLYLPTNSEDSVKVTVRVMDSSNVGLSGMNVSLTTTLGVMTLADTSDNTGTIVTYLQTNKQFGMGLVTARVYDVLATDTLWVLNINQQIHALNVNASPPVLYASPDNKDSTQIVATVVDANNTGISGVPVYFATDFGYLSSSTGTTDINGTRTIKFYSFPNTYGTAHVWAVVGPHSDTCSVAISPTAASNGSITITVSPELLYLANNAEDSLKVTIRVMDSLNVGIPNLTVDLTTTLGVIAQANQTDNSGTTITYVQTNQQFGMGFVTAQVYNITATDTFQVLRADQQVHALNVSTWPAQISVAPDGIDSTLIVANVVDINNNGIPGVPINFAADFGYLSISAGTTDSTGSKTTKYYTMQGAYGTAHIWAVVGPFQDTCTVNISTTASFNGSVTVTTSPDLIYLEQNAEDSIKVTVRVMDSLNVGIPNLTVDLTTTLGVIAQADQTDNSGTTITYVQTNQQFGTGFVAAQVYNVSATDTFQVLRMDQQINALNISAWPTQISVAPDGLDSTLIVANVVDINNNGIPGVTVNFAADFGILSSNAGTTDSNGTKTTKYYTLQGTYGTAHIWAVVGPFQDTCAVLIAPTPSSNGSLYISSSTNLIYADNGLTTANITALLKDADNQAIGNVPVIFTSDHGTINSPVTTDSTGQAHAIFQGLNVPSGDSALVIAKYPALNLADTVRIMIAEARIVSQIVLNSGANSMTANGRDSTLVTATVYLAGNALAPAGTEVHFIVDGDNRGHFLNTISLVTGNGAATSYYQTGNNKGVDSLFALVDDVQSNVVVMQLHAGPPYDIVISVDPPTMPVNNPDPAEVTVTVYDTTGNRVEDNTPVFFTTSLGSLFPSGAQTINGVAMTSLSPSTNAGDAWIKATSGGITDSAIVQFLPSIPSQIGLNADTTFIQVQGTGGNYQTEIHGEVRDASGNLVGNEAMVHFKIENNGFPGGGVNINNNGLEDSTSTNGGIATVVLNAGTNSGPVTIKAWTMVITPPDTTATEIWASGPLVTIVSGPPSTISVGITSATPREAGGDVWQVEAAALVKDTYGNEVVNNNVVHFYILPDSIAEVWGDAFTGNLNWQGNSYEGTAYTTLSYHSPETFEWAYIYAYCMVNGDSIIGSTHYQMPLANGALGLWVIPVAWNYDHPPIPQGDPAIQEARAYLVDGYNNPINGATIIFQSTKGYFYWYANGDGGVHFEKMTGPPAMPVTPPNPPEPPDSAGYAITYLITTEAQAFPDPNANELTAQVTAWVSGYPDVSSPAVTITFTRDGH